MAQHGARRSERPRARAPQRFAGGGPARSLNAIDRMELERHKRKWRKEWEAEQAEQAAREEEGSTDDLEDRLARHHRFWLAAMGPRTRIAYEAYRRTAAEEKGERWEPIDWPRLPWLEDGEEESEGEEE